MPLLLTRPVRLLLVALLALLPAVALPHTTGENYVFLNFRDGVIDGHFEIHFDDLGTKLGVKTEGVDPAEVVAQSAEQVKKYIVEHFTIGPVGGKPYALEFTKSDLFDAEATRFGQYFFRSATGPLPNVLTIRHTLCFEDDPMHRGLVCVQENIKTGINHGEEYVAMVFGPTNPEQTLALTNVPGLIRARELAREGAVLVGTSLDHLLFLVALLLPTVLRSSAGTLEPVPRLRGSLRNLVVAVATFAVAQAAAYVLGGNSLLSLPLPLVDSLVALSIMVAALCNLTGRIDGAFRWLVPALGVFHGLAFAADASTHPFRVGKIFLSLTAYNVGIAAAVLALVLVLFPVLYLLRRKALYVPTVLNGASTAFLLVAAYLFVQRAFSIG